MKLLFLSDLHSANHQNFSTILQNGRNSRLQDALNVIDQALTICLDRNVDAVFFLGDVFHTRARVDTDVYSATWSAFSRFKANGRKLVMLVGNHDQHSKVGDVHALEAFKEIANVIDYPQRVFNSPGYDFNWAAAPFTSNTEQLITWIKSLPEHDVFLFHQGLKEGAVGAFDVYVRAELSLNDLPTDRTKYCLAGHYHKPQWIRERSETHAGVGYIGSPLQIDFGERTEDKSFLLLDTKTWQTERIPTSAPRFVQLDANDFNDSYGDRSSRDFVRVSGTEQSVRDIQHRYPKVAIEIIQEEKTTVARIDEEIVGNDNKMLAAYVQQRNKELDSERLVKLGTQLLIGDNDD